MKQTKDKLTIYYNKDDKDFVQLIIDSYEKSKEMLNKIFQLNTERKINVHIISSLSQYYLISFPWIYWSFITICFSIFFYINKRPILILSIPILIFLSLMKIKKVWKTLGGCTFFYNITPTILIKNPELIDKSDTRIGNKIFNQVPDINKKILLTFIHELTHAFTKNLKSTLWINEGLAMLIVDLYFNKITVNEETLNLLQKYNKYLLIRYKDLSKSSDECIVYNYVRGYWVIKYFYYNNMELLLKILSKKRKSEMIDKLIIDELKIENNLYKKLNELAYDYFKNQNS